MQQRASDGEAEPAGDKQDGDGRARGVQRGRGRVAAQRSGGRDTDYNGESFFVRDAYFTGANDPYKRLRQALKADIDQEAWESLYRTRSRPFAPPSTGTIAVKVINHHGDEVLKTYPIA